MNSGEARYLSNSRSHAAWLMGGSEPVTGFHSVILRLFKALVYATPLSTSSSYPDSVNRVSPPNMTMPKTLAALPINQYATFFSEVSGKKALFVLEADFANAPATSKAGSVAWRGTCVVWYRSWKKGDVLREGWKRRLEGWSLAAWVCLQVKNSFVREGAAFLNKGKDWNIEAIVPARAIGLLSVHLKRELRNRVNDVSTADYLAKVAMNAGVLSCAKAAILGVSPLPIWLVKYRAWR